MHAHLTTENVIGVQIAPAGHVNHGSDTKLQVLAAHFFGS
jgi:hypothetical protein